LVLKTYDPESGVVLKFKTDRAAEVGRLINGLGRLGRHMAALPEKAVEGGNLFGQHSVCGGCANKPLGTDVVMEDAAAPTGQTPADAAAALAMVAGTTTTTNGKPAQQQQQQSGGGGGKKKKKGKK
jgi:hypothetical protein